MSIPLQPDQFGKKEKPIRSLPRRRVLTENLQPTQAYVDPVKVQKIAQADPNTFDTVPVVLKKNGKYLVQDGHHRGAANVVRGERYTEVRIAR